jgi:phage-related minor tail protein
MELETQLRTLQEHKGINDTISQQRQELWRQQARFSVLEEAAKTHPLCGRKIPAGQ